MLVIADSGSTKTSWIISKDNSNIHEFSTIGLNPNYCDISKIEKTILDHVYPLVKQDSEPVIKFYGSGCSEGKRSGKMKNLLESVIKNADVFVGSDLLGASRALLGNKPGIACILGTGSNSGAYDGKSIVNNVSPLGFILGDEGSGTYLGKVLLSDYLKGIMPVSVAKRFNSKYELEKDDIIAKVYKGEFPAKYVSGFVEFISSSIDDPYLNKLVKSSFQTFIDRNISLYDNYKLSKICFTGSVAWHFRKQLQETLANNDLQLGEIIKYPVKRILSYHTMQASN